MYVDACGALKLMLGVFFNYSLPYFETGFLISLDFSDSARLASQASSILGFPGGRITGIYSCFVFVCF